jgi:hypothetical protein
MLISLLTLQLFLAYHTIHLSCTTNLGLVVNISQVFSLRLTHYFISRTAWCIRAPYFTRC